MSTQFDSYPDHQLLEYDKIRSRFSAGHNTYVSASPFPHIVLDGFIRDELTNALLDNIPTSDMPDLFSVSPSLRQLIWELNSSTFIRALEGLTGLDNLIPDPAHCDGGLRLESSGKPPSIQTILRDENALGLEQRLKLELYLNKNWKDEYQGHLELWNGDFTSCVKRIRPLAGRCAIFSLNNYAYHGQSQTLNCPDDVTRTLITVYYYTVGRKREAALLENAQLRAESVLPPPQ